MASSGPSDTTDTTGKKLIKEEETSYTYVHVRMDEDMKQDLLEHANKINASMTSVITSLVENLLYKKDEDEELDEEDQLLDLIVTSLMNLERRMEIRLATLQDTFNSLIGRLIDTQQDISASKPSLLRRKRGTDDEEGAETASTFADILEVDKEEEVYKRIKRYLQQQGTIVELQTVIKQIEIDRSLKEWLEMQDQKAPGWKEALITDAIQEAAIELGFHAFDTI